MAWSWLMQTFNIFIIYFYPEIDNLLYQINPVVSPDSSNTSFTHMDTHKHTSNYTGCLHEEQAWLIWASFSWPRINNYSQFHHSYGKPRQPCFFFPSLHWFFLSLYLSALPKEVLLSFQQTYVSKTGELSRIVGFGKVKDLWNLIFALWHLVEFLSLLRG